MKDEAEKKNNWINSNEVKKELKISDCEIAHLRQQEKLRFKKEANSFLYDKIDIKIIYNLKTK